jgi:hypothetical protein
MAESDEVNGNNTVCTRMRWHDDTPERGLLVLLVG